MGAGVAAAVGAGVVAAVGAGVEPGTVVAAGVVGAGVAAGVVVGAVVGGAGLQMPAYDVSLGIMGCAMASSSRPHVDKHQTAVTVVYQCMEGCETWSLQHQYLLMPQPDRRGQARRPHVRLMQPLDSLQVIGWLHGIFREC